MREKSFPGTGLSGIAAGLLWLGLLMAGWVCAQPAPGSAAASARPPLPDTIDLRASWMLDQLRGSLVFSAF